MKYRIRPSLVDYEVQSYLRGDVIPDDAIDCSLGVNPFGYPAALTQEMWNEGYATISGYPSYPYPALKEAIATYWQGVAALDPAQISLHTGSMGMLIDIHRLFVTEGTAVLVGAPTFSSAVTDMRAMGARVTEVVLQEKEQYRWSADAFLEALSPEHHIVYIDNPNNPTGQVIPLAELERIAQACEKQDTMLIVDEAYGDFMERDNSAIALVNRYDSVMAVRTFSKGFGLAGLRVGYAVCPKDFIPLRSKIPGEMTVTETSARLCATALLHADHVARSCQAIAENKRQLLSALTALKPSVTGDTVPIVLLYSTKEIDLYSLCLRHGVITERGEDFSHLGKRHIRLRVPKDMGPLLTRLQAIEDEWRRL